MCGPSVVTLTRLMASSFDRSGQCHFDCFILIHLRPIKEMFARHCQAIQQRTGTSKCVPRVHPQLCSPGRPDLPLVYPSTILSTIFHAVKILWSLQQARRKHNPRNLGSPPDRSS